VAQPLVIGDAGLKSPFLNVMYGDYEPHFYPDATAATAVDLNNVLRPSIAKDGRESGGGALGTSGTGYVQQLNWEMETLRARLAADPLAAAPDKVLLASPLMQTMSAWGANGISQMSILLYMDAGYPLVQFRKPMAANIPSSRRHHLCHHILKPYPAFRGWSWVANWWVWSPDQRYSGPEEQAAYDRR